MRLNNHWFTSTEPPKTLKNLNRASNYAVLGTSLASIFSKKPKLFLYGLSFYGVTQLLNYSWIKMKKESSQIPSNIRPNAK